MTWGKSSVPWCKMGVTAVRKHQIEGADTVVTGAREECPVDNEGPELQGLDPASVILFQAITKPRPTPATRTF